MTQQCGTSQSAAESPRGSSVSVPAPRAQSVVYHDVNDWFERVDRALYALSTRGRQAIAQHRELADTFRQRIEEAGSSKRLSFA